MKSRTRKLPVHLIESMIEREPGIDGTTPVAATLLPTVPTGRVIRFEPRRPGLIRRPTRLAS
jgi:hypothetical protein